MTKKALFGFALTVLLSCGARAAVHMPAIFSSNMVLQRDVAVPIWGEAEPGETVTVRFAGQHKSVVTDTNGAWRLTLAAMPASAQPDTLTIESDGQTAPHQQVLTNVLVGDVWLCSGQSNMVMPLGDVVMENYRYRGVDHWENEVRKAQFADIRYTGEGPWQVCTPTNAIRFSATAYYFAVNLYQSLHVPIGLINRSVGGSMIESWIPDAAMMTVPRARKLRELAESQEGQAMLAKMTAALAEFRARTEAWKDKPDPKGPKPERPARSSSEADLWLYRAPSGRLFDMHIDPVAPYAIKGILWYQGESNGGTESEAKAYGDLLSALAAGWREIWPGVPFLYVQLPVGQLPNWEWVRAAQFDALSRIDYAGMAVIADTRGGIHSRFKKPVGERLALLARGIVYGEDIVFSGPLYRSMTLEDGKMVLTFRHTGSGLTTRGGTELDGFEIAGPDGVFHVAAAEISGEHVVLRSAQVTHPAAVRYAWQFPQDAANLVNREGLPAAPFLAGRGVQAASELRGDK